MVCILSDASVAAAKNSITDALSPEPVVMVRGAVDADVGVPAWRDDEVVIVYAPAERAVGEAAETFWRREMMMAAEMSQSGNSR